MLKAEAFMREALLEAEKGENEVPVGAVVVCEGEIIARAHNEREENCPFAHAEMLAMEPCPMCAGALMMAEADACVFGAYDPRQGCCGSVYALPEDPAFFHRVPCAGGVLEQPCREALNAFFQKRRSPSTV